MDKKQKVADFILIQLTSKYEWSTQNVAIKKQEN